MEDRVSIEVDGKTETRKIDYYVLRHGMIDGKFTSYQSPIPVFDPRYEYLYENSASMKILSKR